MLSNYSGDCNAKHETIGWTNIKQEQAGESRAMKWTWWSDSGGMV